MSGRTLWSIVRVTIYEMVVNGACNITMNKFMKLKKVQKEMDGNRKRSAWVMMNEGSYKLENRFSVE